MINLNKIQLGSKITACTIGGAKIKRNLDEFCIKIRHGFSVQEPPKNLDVFIKNFSSTLASENRKGLIPSYIVCGDKKKMLDYIAEGKKAIEKLGEKEREEYKKHFDMLSDLVNGKLGTDKNGLFVIGASNFEENFGILEELREGGCL